MLLALVTLGWNAKASPWLVGIIIGNYFGSAWLRMTGDMMLVGFLDATCASLIISMQVGARANIVAGLFLCMLPIYAIGWLIGASVYATFALVELLGWLQIAVVGNVDRGIGRVLGKVGRRHQGQPPHRIVNHRLGGPVSPGNAARADQANPSDGG